MKYLIIVALSLVFSVSAFADKDNPVPGEVIDRQYSYGKPLSKYEIEYKSPEDAHTEISSKNGIKRFEVGDIEGFADISAGNIWVFTLKHNPAHPAVMKLRGFESEKNIYMKTAVKCGASKIECDKFVSYQSLLSNSVIEMHKTYVQSKSPNK